MKIVADDKIPFLRGVLEPFGEVIYLPGRNISKQVVKDADAMIIRTRTKCNEELLSGSTVKFIATATIGFDHIDTVYCENNGIIWINAPGCNSLSVQQYIASVLLTISRGKGVFLKNKVLGIVGVGNVGSKVAVLGELLGMKVLLNDPPRARNEQISGFHALGYVLANSDFVSLHVPLNYEGVDKTYHLANSDFFGKMKKNAFFINSSRGEVHDTEALKRAVQKRDIAGAIVDVWENEPKIDTQLLDLVEIGTPHIAGYSLDGKANGTTMSIRALSKFFNLGIDSWAPDDIPAPKFNHLEIDCSGISDEEVLYKAITSAYDVMDDDNRLRQSVDTFEQQRGEYPIRREFGAFKVSLKQGSEDVLKVLKGLGFGLERKKVKG